jgi:hypothetical protein
MPAPDDPIPPPTSQTPEAKLTRNIREICRRVVRGQAAARNPSVRWQLVLRVGSILLSSLGGVGVVADKASGNLPSETGWAFWGSVILLSFGILSQIANEFQVAQRAADSRSVAERCTLCETQLENILIVDDPRQPVANLLLAINLLFENEKYNRVLPAATDAMETDAERNAQRLLERYAKHWQLKTRPQRSRPPAGKGDGVEPEPAPDEGDNP